MVSRRAARLSMKIESQKKRHRPCYMDGVNQSAPSEKHRKRRRIRQYRTPVNAIRSLDEVADILGLSRQRVYEIESRAFQKMRDAFVHEMPSLEFRRDEYGLVRGLKEVE